MSYTENLNLLLTPDDGGDITFKELRLAMNGEDNSNMQKIDAAFGELSEAVQAIDTSAISGTGYLPIANERPFGSIEIPTTHSLQGFCSYKLSDEADEYIVFAIANHDTGTKLYLYNYTDDVIEKIVDVTQLSAGNEDPEMVGHYNDMTFCPNDEYIYVANYSNKRIDVYDTQLNHVRYIDTSSFGVIYQYLKEDGTLTDNSALQGRVQGIAWSEKENCFYVGFRDISELGRTKGMFRFSHDFSEYTQFDFAYGSMSRQGIYVERETGNIMQVKYRRSRSFRFPYGDRIHIHNTKGKLIAVTYVDSEREIEGICQLSNGEYLFGFYAKDSYTSSTRPAGESAKKAAIFTIGTVSSQVGLGLYTTPLKTYLSTSAFDQQTNNIYYDETKSGTGLLETGSSVAPFRTWPSLLNFIHANTTKLLRIHCLSSITWPVELVNFKNDIAFYGETSNTISEDTTNHEEDSTEENIEGSDSSQIGTVGTCTIADLTIQGCYPRVVFENLNLGGFKLIFTRNQRIYFNSCTLFSGDTTWADNDLLSFKECDLSNIGSIDLLRTRLVLLDQPMAYGANTRLHGVGVSYRIYGDTTAEEQFVLRGQDSATPNIACSALTAISQIRMNMNMSVSENSSVHFTDLPPALAGASFTGRAEVLNNSKMLYIITRGGEEYRRLVSFNDKNIIDDSGWMTRDNSLYPINTVVAPEARSDKWENGKIVLFGDSIAAHTPHWVADVATATGCTYINYALGGAGFIHDPNNADYPERGTIPKQVNYAITQGALTGASLIVIAAGTNDAAHEDCTGAQFRTAVESVISTLQTAAPLVPIIFVTPIRREKNSSTPSGAYVQSRQRLVSAAICNTALLNGCSVVNGFDMPISVSSNDWVENMSTDGLHPTATGNMIYARCFLQATH